MATTNQAVRDQQEVVRMRAFDCPCGEYLTGSNDQDLATQMREHVDQVHADAGYTDGQLQQMRDQSAYDVREDQASA